MNIRNLATSLTLAAGALLFVAQPALHAQDYYNDGRYSPRYDRHLDREERAIEHDRQEINRYLARGDYRAARREERELERREQKLARERYRRHYDSREYEGYGYR